MSELELKPIHQESWDRFWQQFEIALDRGVNDLVSRLAEEGVCALPQRKLSVTLISTPEQSIRAEEEKLAKIRDRNLEQAVSVNLSVGDKPWKLGHVPILTKRGTFIRGGAEYALLGQLTHSSGVFLHHPNSPTGVYNYAEIISVKNHHIYVVHKGEENLEIRLGGRTPVAWTTLRNVLNPSSHPEHKDVMTVAKAIGLTVNSGDGDNDGLLRAIRSHINSLDIGELGERQLNNRFARFGLRPVPPDFSEGEFVGEFTVMALCETLTEGGIAGNCETVADLNRLLMQPDLYKNLKHYTEDKRLLARINKLEKTSNESRTEDSIKKLNRVALEVIFPKVTPQVSRLSVGMLDSIVSLLVKFSKAKDAHGDDWSDIGNLRVRLVGDFLQEALDAWLKTLHRRILANWNKSGKSPLSIFAALNEANGEDSSRTCFTDAFRRWTVEMPICQRIPAVGANYVAAVALSRRLTFNGPGGIRIGHQRIPREFKWSHYGRLCPFDTPQSVDVGVTLSLAAGARINELGQIDSLCYSVDDGKVSSDIVWLSPLDEADKSGWIAFPDERDALESGKDVYAHRSGETLKRIKPDEVTHIHVSENAMLSIAASLVPYRKHNDAVRMNMACNFLRQALSLKTASAPRILANAEELPSEDLPTEEQLPKALPFDAGLRDAGRLAFGKDLTVGYMIWKGWNFEDAIVISESAAEALTSCHFERLKPEPLSRSLLAQESAYQEVIKNRAPDENIKSDRFDDRGFIKVGTEFEREQVFLLVPSTEWRKNKQPTLVPIEYRIENDDDYHGPAVVHAVEACDDNQGRGWMRVLLRRERRAQVGDKLANRHGHKGVISKILPEHEMPYVVLDGKPVAPCACGETRRHLHMQVLINPLSVISRMNLGQLFETSEARRGELVGLPEKLECHDPAIKAIGARKLDDKVLVGAQYIMKLDHNAEDKLHARATEKNAYSAFVQQPLGGRRLKGGQRLGEMEVWALQAHGVPNLLQEMLTLKSDNPWSRRILLSDISTGGNKAESELPEALRTFTAISYGLGLRLALVGHGKHWMDPSSDKLLPDDAEALHIGLLNGKSFTKNVSKGEVTAPKISGQTESPKIRFHKDGLESEALFGPLEDFTCACEKHRRGESGRACAVCGTPFLPKQVRRRRMAHIKLAKPVPNPFILFSAPVTVGSIRIAFDPSAKDSDTAIVLSGILDNTLKATFPSTSSKGKLSVEIVRTHAMQFVHLCVLASEDFRAALEERLGRKIPEEAISDESLFDQAADWLFNEAVIAETGLAAAGRCGKVVNALLQNSVNCPLDFVEKLLQLRKAPESLMLTILPVIPPDLRRPFKLKNTFERNDLTILYQKALYANQDLMALTGKDQTDFLKHRRTTLFLDKEQKEITLSDIDMTDLVKYRRTVLFRAIARLMCNQLLPYSDRDWNSEKRQQRESLSSLLSGKEGLLVGNLLGKRVDFSARAVIVPDPNLPMDSCVLPYDLAIKLYKPLLVHYLRLKGEDDALAVVSRAFLGDEKAVKTAKDGLRELFKDYWVVLNRQPTLHRLGMLTFKPRLGSGSAIAIPAMVTAGFNADFDGDQMAVYLPLTEKARAEAKNLLPSLHLWRPRDGRFALSLAQDITLGMWLDNKGTAIQAARAMESRVGNANIINDIEKLQADAFLRASQSGTSVSIEDFKVLGDLTGSGDEENMKVIFEKQCHNSSLGRILNSGARGNISTMKYLVGTEYAERSKSNLTDGLRLGERFHQAQAGRQRVVETKLGTAEGGGLTKRFVASSQHICVTSENCSSETGLSVTWQLAGKILIDPNKPSSSDVLKVLKRWIYGKVLARAISPLGLEAGAVIGGDSFDLIQDWLNKDEARSVVVRSPTHCNDSGGVCRACFGVPPWHGIGWRALGQESLVPIGTAVGLIAAQSAGEPGTQMALRRKHLSGQVESDEGVDLIRAFKDHMMDLHLAFELGRGNFNFATFNQDDDEVGREIEEEDLSEDEGILVGDGSQIGSVPHELDLKGAEDMTPSSTIEKLPLVVEKNGPSFYEHKLARVDAFLVGNEIELSIVHLDTMIRGSNLSNLAQWIAQLSAPGRGFEYRFASSALDVDAQTDSLMDLRSQTVVGGKVGFVGRSRS